MLNALLLTLSIVGSAHAAGYLSSLAEEVEARLAQNLYSFNEIIEQTVKALNDYPAKLSRLITDLAIQIEAETQIQESYLKAGLVVAGSEEKIAQLTRRKQIFESLLAKAQDSTLKPQDIKGLDSTTIIALAGAVGLGSFAAGYLISKETESEPIEPITPYPYKY